MAQQEHSLAISSNLKAPPPSSSPLRITQCCQQNKHLHCCSILVNPNKFISVENKSSVFAWLSCWWNYSVFPLFLLKSFLITTRPEDNLYFAFWVNCICEISSEETTTPLTMQQDSSTIRKRWLTWNLNCSIFSNLPSREKKYLDIATFLNISPFPWKVLK